MRARARAARRPRGLAKELSWSIVLLCFTGTSIGGFIALVSVLTRALGR